MLMFGQNPKQLNIISESNNFYSHVRNDDFNNIFAEFLNWF